MKHKKELERVKGGLTVSHYPIKRLHGGDKFDLPKHLKTTSFSHTASSLLPK